MSARFLVAKYIPDVRRMEPRNIGVVVWHGGHVEARFLGENDGPPRYIGVKDRTNYGKWLASWRAQLAKPFLEAGSGETINRSSPRFLDALCGWSRGNYVLVEGGDITESLDRDSLAEATEYLFSELVSHKETVEEKEHEYQHLRALSLRVS